MILAVLALASSGCHPREQPLRLHYLTGIVPGSQNIFRPVKIAVVPARGNLASGWVEVGAIYAHDGNVQKQLQVNDAGTVVTAALIQALRDAGLSPVALDSMPTDGKPPVGADYILICELENIEVNKRFRAQQTIHGQYFTMKSAVRLRFSLTSRAGDTVYSAELTGTEQEPPAPVGLEVFFPLETEPAESLSVALSRAVGAFMVQPGLAKVLPLRTAAGAVREAAPAPTAIQR